MGLGKDDGTLAEQLYYNSTGLCKSWDPSGGGNWNTHPDNADYNLGRSEYIPFGYLGMYRDRFTGKYHTHFREYDPLHARWLSEDPAGYADGLNLYNAYMGVNGIDPFGLGVDIDNLTTDQMADLLTDPDSAPSEALPDDMILTRPTDLLKFREGRILLAIYLLDGSAGLSRYAPQAVAIGHELDNAVESNGEVYFSYGVTVGETKAAVRGREALEYGKQRCRTLAAEFAREGTALILSEIGGKGIQVFAKFVRAMRRSATLWKRGLGGCDDMAIGASKSLTESGTAVQSTPTRAIERRCWRSSTEFQGSKVYTRDDLIDLSLKDARGRTNLQRMKKGLSPIGPDGKPINIHHLTQDPSGAMAEVTQSMHQKNYRILHINTGQSPSGIDRPAHNIWRRGYWMNRSTQFIIGGP